MERKTKLARLAAAWLAVCALCLPLLLGSCGDDEYEKPLTTQTPTALISPATLRAWMDAGLVNGEGFDRVIIVDVNTSANYNTGHIPGARFLDYTRMSQHRLEGPAVSSTEMVTGENMDVIIRELGITKNTTLVFTGSAYWQMSRAYYTFRYWGFPKNRLKVLDGINLTGANTWRALYAPVLPDTDYGTDAPPPAVATAYSVRDNGTLRNDLRISLSEMIDYAEGKVSNALAIDVRGATTSYAGTAGSTGSTFGASDQPVFEGHINGAKAMTNSDVYVTASIFKDPATIAGYFTPLGLDSTKTAYLYCKVGFLGPIVFFALDGILGWPAAFYDGSWTQWGQLSANASMGGTLAANSPWRTDTASRSELIVYNRDWNNDSTYDYAIELLSYDGSKCSGTLATSGAITYSPAGCDSDPALLGAPESLVSSGNQIEGDDMEYMKSGSGGSGGGGGSGGC